MIKCLPAAVLRLGALAAALVLLTTSLSPNRTVRAETPVQHRVVWDSHSLLIDGRRILVYAGEFHYWRLPSQQEWTDRLEKMKAAGLNAVSIYFDWQYHSNAPGEYDFTGARDVDKLLSICDRLGLYVLARVGPYMNAEADAGGLPGWVLNKPLLPRSQVWNGRKAQARYSALFVQYSKEWYDHILPILERHQVTNGGSVLLLSVENEYSQPEGSTEYMQDLIRFARADGINVPIFHNDFYFRGDWRNLVDLYAFDSYSYLFKCCHQWDDRHFHGIDTWEKVYREQLHITTPLFLSELQGGSFDPWHGVGYGAIARTLNGDWLAAENESALAQGASLLNTYMFAGGTSWGYMAEPGVYTSYDYGAPISEAGNLRPSFYSAHRLGMFLQAYGSSLAGTNAATSVSSTNAHVMVHSRVNSQSRQLFIFLRQGDPGKAMKTTLRLQAGGKRFQVPEKKGTGIVIPGHGAQVLMANTDVGPLHMNYTSSEVLTDADTASGHYLVLDGPKDASGESNFVLPADGVHVVHNADVEVNRQGSQLRLNYRYTAEPRTVELQTSRGVLRILITSTSEASRYWMVNQMLVAGPDLVTSDGGELKVVTDKSRAVDVYGAPAEDSLRIDGRLTAAPDAVMGRIMLGDVSGPLVTVLPQLNAWRFQAEAPEINPAFNDAGWISADHTTTANPNVPANDTLLADDYGFHYGFVWYRGHFVAKGTESAIILQARQSYSVYLNGVYLGSADESLADPPHAYARSRTFGFPTSLLHVGQDNVLAVLTESLGHDEGWLAGPVAQSPQGLLTAQLDDPSTSIQWRIQGAEGGEHPKDRQRGLMNASGLYGERQGWYLLSYNDEGWQSVSMPDDWRARSVDAEVGWYRTKFDLDLPAGMRQPIGITLPKVSDKAVIWVNGWMLGRYWQQRGPQHTFYLPDGILNSHGGNTVAIAVWNRGHDGGLLTAPTLSSYSASRSHSLNLVSTGGTSETDYWHTSGNRIVDSHDRPVRIAAVNWFGMENIYYVPAGLEKQRLDDILQRVKENGFNAIRLPFSNQLVETNPIVTTHLDANPDLRGLHALDIMDRVVEAAGRYGLRIILDDGRSDPGTEPEPNGLWYTKQYPESAWIRDWVTLVNRYKGNATVVAADIRNEPHTGPPGPWSVKTYLNQGATWGPYKGIENEKTDWRLAAERGGNAVLAANPKLLVLVEGIQQYPDATWPGGVESYWWGGVLQPAKQYPVQLDVPHQLVYSPHEYGPLKWQMPFFGPHMSYQSQSKVWDKHWAFLEKGQFSGQAPILIGEFGTCGDSKRCIFDTKPGSQGLWFHILIQYLKRHAEIGWAFWALNGTSHRGGPTHHYILKADWKHIQQPYLLDTFRDVEVPPSPE